MRPDHRQRRVPYLTALVHYVQPRACYGLRSGLPYDALPYDTYPILRTTEDSWGLPRLGGAACRCTPPLTAMFRASTR